MTTPPDARNALAEIVAGLDVADLEALVAFTLSDASRLLRKQDVQGVCPHPDDCFYFGEHVRCGPCAVKASAAKGIEIDDTHSHLPEVCRLRREARSDKARIAALEAQVEGMRVALKPFAKYAGDLSHIKQRAFLQLLICPLGDDHPENYIPHFQAARAALQSSETTGEK